MQSAQNISLSLPSQSSWGLSTEIREDRLLGGTEHSLGLRENRNRYRQFSRYACPYPWNLG